MLIPLKTQMADHGVKPRVVLHIGAHLGEEARDYERAGVEKVVWVEANPDLIGRLAKTIGRRRIHTVICAAAGPPEMVGQTATLHLADNGPGRTNGQSSSLLEPGTHLTHHPTVHFDGEREVEMDTIDNICTRHHFSPDYLALDIQGFELEALKGAVVTLWRSVKWVYAETNTEDVYRGCALTGELDEFLDDKGFLPVATQMAGDAGWGDRLYVRRGI